MPNETILDELEHGDRVEITLSDGSEILGLLESDPDTGPPTTPDGEAAGWDEKTLLGSVHAEERNGSATAYDSLMLIQERRGDEWGEIEVVGYRYEDGDYHPDDLDAAEVEVRGGEDEIIVSRQSALECTICGDRFRSWDDADDHAEEEHGK